MTDPRTPPALSNATPRDLKHRKAEPREVLTVTCENCGATVPPAFACIRCGKNIKVGAAAPPVAEGPAATPRRIPNEAAVKSAIAFIKASVAPRQCDSDGVATCIRCTVVFLARAMNDLLKVWAAPSGVRQAEVNAKVNADYDRVVEEISGVSHPQSAASSWGVSENLTVLPAVSTEPPEMNWVNLRGRLSDEEAATYKAAAAEPFTPNPVEGRAAAQFFEEYQKRHRLEANGGHLTAEHTRDMCNFADAYAADLLRQLDNWKANARTAREYWRSAEAANQELRRWLPISEAPRTGEHILVTSLTDSWGTCGGKKQRPHAIVHWFDDAFYLSLGNQDEPQIWPTHFKYLDEAAALLVPSEVEVLGPQHGDTK